MEKRLSVHSIKTDSRYCRCRLKKTCVPVLSVLQSITAQVIFARIIDSLREPRESAKKAEKLGRYAQIYNLL